LDCGEGIVDQDEDSLFGESVYNDKDGGVSSQGWELFYEIH